MVKLITLLALAVSAFGQTPSQAVNQVQGPPPAPVVSLYFYSGANLVNICYAPAQSSLTTYYKSSSTLTSIVVATNVGTINFPSTAQLWVGQQVTVAGSSTSALNGNYVISAVSGSTATITTSGVMDGTYNNAALTLSTTGPVLNAPVWSIAVFTYSGSSITGSHWAGASGQSVPQGLLCSNRGNY